MSCGTHVGPPLTAWIDAVALWSPRWPDWQAACAAFRAADEEPAACLDPGAPPLAARPAPTLLPANERRRAPDSVLVAMQVAQTAVAASGREASSLASIFCSAHGDLPIIDALCRTLAADPMLLSPTRFHHSVHNAASGYWAIAACAHAPSTALAAYRHTFACGLLEAMAWCGAERTPVLLVGCDTEACGALASVNTSRGLLGLALVLAPERGKLARWRLDAGLGMAQPAATPRSAAARALQGNAIADGLPLFEALAGGSRFRLALPLGPASGLDLSGEPLLNDGTC